MIQNAKTPDENVWDEKIGSSHVVELKLHLEEKLEWGGDSLNSCKKEKKGIKVFATNSEIPISKTLQPNLIDLIYIKLWIMFYGQP